MNTYTNKLTLKQWAEDDKPREKLTTKGRHALSDAELVAITLGSGSTEQTAVELAKSILAAANNNLFELGKLTLTDLCKFKGVGPAKAISLIAALELGRRRSEHAPLVKPKIIRSKEAYLELAPHLIDLEHEAFWILLLNRSNQLEEKIQVSSGGLVGTIVDLRIIFKKAIEKLASSIVLCHNHPSGNPKPSPEDILLTRKLVEAGKLLEIQVVDHIIIAGNTYYSFADNDEIR